MAKQVSEILSHWHKLFEGFQESPQNMYSLLEKAIEKRQLPKVKISRINYKESGMLSAKREYLRVRRKNHIFDVCAAPFGTSFFLSWWLGDTESGGTLIRIKRVFRPLTYFSLDTALMFQDSVHSAVLEVIEQLTEGKGLKALSELEKKPTLSNLFMR